MFSTMYIINVSSFNFDQAGHEFICLNDFSTRDSQRQQIIGITYCNDTSNLTTAHIFAVQFITKQEFCRNLIIEVRRAIIAI